MVEKQWCNAYLLRVKFIKDIMRIKRPVITTYSCMISTYNKMCTAVIFPHQGVKDRLSRSGIPHSGRKNGQHSPILGIIFFQKNFITFNPHLCRDIVAFCFPYQRVQKYGIHYLQGTLLDIFVRAMHRITSLESNHPSPPLFYKHLSGFSRIQPVCQEITGFCPVYHTHLEEIFHHDKPKESLEVYGTDDKKHPGVDYVSKMGEYLL